MNTTDLPLQIGLTGHRDLLEPERVWKSLIAFFEQIAVAFPSRKIRLVSGFAAGADQMFIEAGMQVLKERAETVAVLPFSQSEFQRDFSSEELPAFLRLMESATAIVELPGSRENEADAYFAVGQYLVDNVNILVAVWDGNVAYGINGEVKRGGTWEVADLWMYGNRKQLQDVSSKNRLPMLIHIPAKRIPKDTRIDKPYKPGGDECSELNRIVFDSPSGKNNSLATILSVQDTRL